ncbi:MAG: divergent PAP2 family protein [Ruminococcus sp.]|nr:divergent PAP2 family protein [Ruminococcus sp.]
MFYNYIFVAAVVGWGSAQVIKTVLYLVFNKAFRFERLFGAGGMPSSHSAMVCAAIAACARVEAVNSPIFAAFAVFGLITMYDAMSVRRASGQHAQAINRLNKMFDLHPERVPEHDSRKRKNKELKEFLGHTPLEVFCGALLGIGIAFIVPISL